MGREGEKVSQQWINRGFVSLSASVRHLSPVFIRKPHMQRSQNCRKFKTQHEKKLNGYENFSETWFPELRCLLLPILLYIWCCSLKYQITQLLTRFSLTFASYSSTKSCFWVQEAGKKFSSRLLFLSTQAGPSCMWIITSWLDTTHPWLLRKAL